MKTVDFDAFVSSGRPVFAFKWGGFEYVVDGIDIEAFAGLADVQNTIEPGDVIGMLRTLKEMVRDQLRETDRDRWMQSRPPYQVLTGICEALTEAATGRPTVGLSSSGGLSSETGQPSNPSSSEVGTLPPPSAA